MWKIQCCNNLKFIINKVLKNLLNKLKIKIKKLKKLCKIFKSLILNH